MAKKDSKPETQRKDKGDKRDETIATLDTSDETARLDVDLDANRPVGLPDAASRLDVLRDGNLEGLEKEAAGVAPDGIGEIKDNLGNDIARHDGPGIADMFKSSSKYGLTGTDKTDPLSGQPQIPDDDGAPETPFRDDPSLASSGHGGLTKDQGHDFLGLSGGGGGGPDKGGIEGKKYELMGHRAYLDHTTGPAGKAALDAHPDAKAKADADAKAKADADAKAKADADAKAKADADDKAKNDKGGDKGGDDKDTTYTTGEVEWTPTLDEAPLTARDLLGHRVDPGDEQVFEIDESQVEEVIKAHSGPAPTEILTSAEELPATVDLSTPPTVPGSELENTGNPLDANAPPPLPQGGSTTGPPSGGGCEGDGGGGGGGAGGGGIGTDGEGYTAALDTAALDTAAMPAGAPAVPAGSDFAESPPGAQQAAPAPGGVDLDDDPDGDGIPG